MRGTQRLFLLAPELLQLRQDTHQKERTMTNGSWIAVSALVGLMATSAANASLITIDANAYTSGTDVSNAFTGVTLSHLTWTSAGKQTNPVYAAECADVSNPSSPCSAIGPASFGRMTSTSTVSPSWFSSSSVIINCLKQNYSYCYSTPQHLLEASFDQATDFVTVDSTHSSSPATVAMSASTPSRTRRRSNSSITT